MVETCAKELNTVSSKISLLESECAKLGEREIKADEIERFLGNYLSYLQKKIDESNNAFKIKNNHIEIAEAYVDGVQIINNVLLKREEACKNDIRHA